MHWYILFKWRHRDDFYFFFERFCVTKFLKMILYYTFISGKRSSYSTALPSSLKKHPSTYAYTYKNNRSNRPPNLQTPSPNLLLVWSLLFPARSIRRHRPYLTHQRPPQVSPPTLVLRRAWLKWQKLGNCHNSSTTAEDELLPKWPAQQRLIPEQTPHQVLWLRGGSLQQGINSTKPKAVNPTLREPEMRKTLCNGIPELHLKRQVGVRHGGRKDILGRGQYVQRWGGRRKHGVWGNQSKVSKARTNTVRGREG